MDPTAVALEPVHDIVLPSQVSWAPHTAGWWGVLALLLAASVYAAVRVRQHHRANRYRRLALGELARLERELEQPASRKLALRELPVLVKRTALSRWPRSKIASLSGEAWLGALDESYGGDGFRRGPGRLLPMLAYSTLSALDSVTAEDATALVDLVRNWIRSHRVRV